METPKAINKRKRQQTNGPISNKRQRSISPVSASLYTSDDCQDEDSVSGTDTPPTPTTPKSPSSKSAKRPKIYKCPYPVCAKAFDRPARLDMHLRTHTNYRPFKCPHAPCTKDFLRNEHLSQHIAAAHVAEKKYPCTWSGCDKAFSTAQRLGNHVSSHEKKDQFTCKDYAPCAESFRKHNTLQRHVETVHLHLAPYRCEHIDLATGESCGEGFPRPRDLRSHKVKRHGKPQYWCSICSATSSPHADGTSAEAPGFANYQDLQTHISMAHPPACPACGFLAPSSGLLQQHIDMHHHDTLAERRVFACSVPGCDRGFTKRGNLAMHVRSVHENRKAFECGVADVNGCRGLEGWDGGNACHRALTTKQSLADHVRRHHLPGSVSKMVRKGKVRRAQRYRPSPAEELTGQSGGVACPVALCGGVFVGQGDVELHCHTAHGMDEGEIFEAMAEREALTGGRFWIGGDDGEEDEAEPEDFTGLGGEAVRIDGGIGVPWSSGGGVGSDYGNEAGTALDAQEREREQEEEQMAAILSSYVDDGGASEEMPLMGNIDPVLLGVPVA